MTAPSTIATDTRASAMTGLIDASTTIEPTIAAQGGSTFHEKVLRTV